MTGIRSWRPERRPRGVSLEPDYDQEEPASPLFEENQSPIELAVSAEGAVDAQIESEQRWRRRRMAEQTAALDEKVKGIDLSAWMAENTGSAHVVAISSYAQMTPIDTRPIDPYLGCGSITEIMRRPRDESHVDNDGNSRPSGGSGSFAGGGISKPKSKKKVQGLGPEPAEAATICFRVRNLSQGEKAMTDILRHEGRLNNILLLHVGAIIRKEVAFIPVSVKRLPGEVFIDCYFDDGAAIELQILRVHRGSARRAIVEAVHERFHDRILAIDRSFMPETVAV